MILMYTAYLPNLFGLLFKISAKVVIFVFAISQPILYFITKIPNYINITSTFYIFFYIELLFISETIITFALIFNGKQTELNVSNYHSGTSALGTKIGC